ncbi:YfcC family protein [Geotoga petraea]|jgi:uncharacterized ion transporter superfamily protein YfcC|uniref:YfcC family protein n=1 Tax=Geotoga petraea TaxID=28234 RepID=A0A4Z0W3H7_9BACT|nr:AbgT family transporter [Geotoga petraea]TGG87875.1 YfcC family protein [Geotoga petraea]
MKNSVEIGKRTFFISVLIIFSIMMISGVLTKTLPSGEYQREIVNGREIIIENSYSEIEKPDYPVWRWFTAPIEVLWSSDSTLIITIIIFILVVSGAIYVLNKNHVIEYIINNIVIRYKNQKYILMSLVILVFMLFGALMGIFEEIVPLIPIMIMFAASLGWDKLTGLGMSLLAAGFGFSAAIANPFSLGVAQRIADVPVFSGIGFRLIIFATTYALLLGFMILHVRKNHSEAVVQEMETSHFDKNVSKASKVLASIIIILFVLILISGFTGFMSGLMLPVSGILFLIAGILSGLIIEKNILKVLKDFVLGMKDVLPGVLLILLAMSVKHIIMNGKILDTILFNAAEVISTSGPVVAVFLIYLLFFVMNLFIGSASAKAFLTMPIIVPLADLVGITRQTAVQAFVFGDGFSNLLYPTNAVLLISLGIAGVSFVKWFKFVWKIQAVIFLVSLIYLFIAVKIGYGPI